jgi:hypothetical protein
MMQTNQAYLIVVLGHIPATDVVAGCIVYPKPRHHLLFYPGFTTVPLIGKLTVYDTFAHAVAHVYVNDKTAGILVGDAVDMVPAPITAHREPPPGAMECVAFTPTGWAYILPYERQPLK